MNLLEYNSIFYKIIKAVFNVAEFTKLMLYNCIKVVRLKPDRGYRPVISHSISHIQNRETHTHRYVQYNRAKIDDMWHSLGIANPCDPSICYLLICDRLKTYALLLLMYQYFKPHLHTHAYTHAHTDI